MSSEKRLAWVADFLRHQNTLTLSTVDADGLPAVAPLFYIVAEPLTLCWLSSPNSQHSRNLQHAAQVAVAVYRPAQHWQQIGGVQMRGVVEQISDAAQRKPLVKRYCQHFQLGVGFRLLIRQSTLYAFQPHFVRVLDNSKRFAGRFELDL